MATWSFLCFCGQPRTKGEAENDATEIAATHERGPPIKATSSKMLVPRSSVPSHAERINTTQGDQRVDSGSSASTSADAHTKALTRNQSRGTANTRSSALQDGRERVSKMSTSSLELDQVCQQCRPKCICCAASTIGVIVQLCSTAPAQLSYLLMQISANRGSWSEKLQHAAGLLRRVLQVSLVR